MIIKVEAMIREEKLEDVLDALAALDVHGMTCYQVMGCGTQRGFKEYAYVRGHQQVEIQMLPKIKIEVLVSSEEWEKKTIDAIQKAAYTGNIGDGKDLLAMMCGRQCESAPRKPAMMRFSRNKRAI